VAAPRASRSAAPNGPSDRGPELEPEARSRVGGRTRARARAPPSRARPSATSYVFGACPRLPEPGPPGVIGALGSVLSRPYTAPVTERTLTTRERNRALLARQLLLERADRPVPEAIERIGGVQSQYAPSAYVGVWTRITRFARDDLTSALTRRTVVQGTLMRGTIHLVSRGDYPAMAAGVRSARRAWWVRTRGGVAGEREMRATAERARELLAGGPRPRRELTRLLGVDATIWNGVGFWLDLIRVPPSGTTTFPLRCASFPRGTRRS
jgi:hypothetical protein